MMFAHVINYIDKLIMWRQTTNTQTRMLNALNKGVNKQAGVHWVKRLHGFEWNQQHRHVLSWLIPE